MCIHLFYVYAYKLVYVYKTCSMCMCTKLVYVLQNLCKLVCV